MFDNVGPDLASGIFGDGDTGDRGRAPRGSGSDFTMGGAVQIMNLG